MVNDEETMKRIEQEIIDSIDKEILETIGKEKLAIIIKKILAFYGSKKSTRISIIDEVKLTTGVNKNGEKLIYIRSTLCHSDSGEITYRAFDLEGNYVGVVNLMMNDDKTDTITASEMTYLCAEDQRGKGNLTIFAQDVIKEVFQGKLAGGMLARRYNKDVQIDKIVVHINKDNYPSLAVARKLGFDETGVLTINDYYDQQENETQHRI